MYQVGTQAGVVNKQRQGTGLATVLQDTEQADDYFLKYMGARADAAEKKAAEKEAAKNAALAKIMNVNPEYFYKHQGEVADQVKRVQELGVLAMQSGANDPAVGADPYSVEYQKELNKLNQMSRVSTQIRDQFKAFQQDVQAKGADYFDPETLTAWDAYANTSLSDFMQNPASPPIVKQKTPYKDALVMAGTLAETIGKGLQEGVPADPATVRRTVREFFADAKDGAVNAKSAAETYANLPDARKQELADRAIQYGISGPEQMLIEMVDAQMKDPTPYNPAESLAKAKFEVSEFDVRGAETFTAGVSKEKSMPAAMSEANRLLNEKPDAFPAWARYYNLEQGAMSEKDFREKVQRRIATDLWERAKKYTKSGVVPGSGVSPEQKKRVDDWRQTILSGNSYAVQLAADALRNVEIGNGYKVERAFAEPIPTGEGNKTKVQIRLMLKGPVKSVFTKQDAIDMFGLKEAEVKEGQQRTLEGGQLEKEMVITTDAENQEFFRSMYLEAEKNGYRWEGFQETMLPGGGKNAPIQEVRSETERIRGAMSTPSPSKPASTIEELLNQK